jgi:hypothetical protein
MSKKIKTIRISVALMIIVSIMSLMLPTKALFAQDDITQYLFNDVSDKDYIKAWGPSFNGGWQQDPQTLVEISASSFGNYFWSNGSDFYSAMFGPRKKLQPKYGDSSTGLRLSDIAFDLKKERIITGLNVGGYTKHNYPTCEVWYSDAAIMPGAQLSDGWTKVNIIDYNTAGKITFSGNINARHIRFHALTSKTGIPYYYDMSGWKILGPASQFNGALTDIEIRTPPTKTTYYSGIESFDKTGMVVYAKYSDLTSYPIGVYTVSPSGVIPQGTTSVDISYTKDGITKTKSQAITTIQKTSQSLVITKKPNKTFYNVGQSFDKTGMTATINFTDGTSLNLVDRQLSVEPTELTHSLVYLEEEVTSVRVSAGGEYALQQISVRPITTSVNEISVTEPNKMNYVVGDYFDTTGMVVKAKLSDGSQPEIFDYTVSKTTPLVSTDETNGIIISFKGKTAKIYPKIESTTTDIVPLVFPSRGTLNSRVKTWGPVKDYNGNNATDGTLELKTSREYNFDSADNSDYWGYVAPTGNHTITPGWYTSFLWDIAFDLNGYYCVNKLSLLDNQALYSNFEIWYSDAEIMPGMNFNDGWKKATNARIENTSYIIFDSVNARHIRFHLTSPKANLSSRDYLNRFKIFGYKAHLKGDINLDDKLTAGDILAIKNHINNGTQLTGVYFEYANIYSDAVIDSKDLEEVEKLIGQTQN